MSRVSELKNSYEERIGSLSFDENPQQLSARRTAAGFVISFPVAFSIIFVKQDDDMPVVNGLGGRLWTGFDSGPAVDLGRLVLDREITAGWTQQGTGEKKGRAYMEWRGTFEELAVYEKIREGRPPQFKVDLEGELRYLLKSNHPRYRLCSEPQKVSFDYSNTIDFGYPAEGWVKKVLHGLGVAQNVLVEIPLASSPPAPWDEVWQFLVKARQSFERGGSTGWEGCVVAVRQALERWEKIEPPQVGPAAPRQRSKAERIDNLRVALHSCTHVWVHGQSPQCARDEAVLMLSTLSALLAERNP